VLSQSIPLPAIPYGKLQTVAKYTGLVLAAVFPKAPYIATAIAGKQIPHPHVHRAPANDEADWAKRLGKALPRLELSDMRKDDILELVTSGAQVQELWEQCDQELGKYGPADPLTLSMMRRLVIPLQP
jgi:hypothetical protein